MQDARLSKVSSSLLQLALCAIGRCHIITLAASLHMLPSLAVRSLAENNLTNYGKDMSGVEALAAALKDTQISDLK